MTSKSWHFPTHLSVEETALCWPYVLLILFLHCYWSSMCFLSFNCWTCAYVMVLVTLRTIMCLWNDLDDENQGQRMKEQMEEFRNQGEFRVSWISDQLWIIIPFSNCCNNYQFLCNPVLPIKYPLKRLPIYYNFLDPLSVSDLDGVFANYLLRL